MPKALSVQIDIIIYLALLALLEYIEVSKITSRKCINPYQEAV